MTKLDLVLGLHPSTRGLGWALFGGPNALVDCGSVAIHGADKNAKTQASAGKLMDKYRPHSLVLEAFDHPLSQRRVRIWELGRTLLQEAGDRGIAVHIYSRPEIASALGVTSRKGRYAVAEAVASRIKILRPRLPRPKKIWLGERHHMGLFCAVASVLTHYDRQSIDSRAFGSARIPRALPHSAGDHHVQSNSEKAEIVRP